MTAAQLKSSRDMTKFCCPACGEGTRVTLSNWIVGGSYRKRRRYCVYCGHEFVTHELNMGADKNVLDYQI